MVDTRNLKSPESHSVHVSFHLVGDTTFPQQKQELEGVLADIFGKTFSLAHEDPAVQQDREVIYRIQKPVMEGEALNREFFVGLQRLFNDTHRYLPTFTQVSEKAE